MLNVPLPMPETKTVAFRSDTRKIPEPKFKIWLVSAVEVMVNGALLKELAPRLPVPVLENVYKIDDPCAEAANPATIRLEISFNGRRFMVILINLNLLTE